MKESPRRYTNPFLSDEENEKLDRWNQELEHATIKHETELYTDKNVMECELPELIICCKESDFQVKDICIDEGVPNRDRILFDENDNEMLNPVLEPSNDHDEVTERKSDAVSGTKEVDADILVNGPISDRRDTGHVSINTEIKAQDLQNSVHHKEEVVNSVGPNEFKETSKDDTGFPKSAPGGFIFSSERISSGDKSLDNISTEQVASNNRPLLEQEHALPSLKSLLEIIDQQPCQSPVEEISERPFDSGNTTLNVTNTKPATSSENVQYTDNLDHVDELHGTGSHNIATVHSGEGGSSFSNAGPVSEHITYSGPIVFSGSTSLRSESSTTSTRSFAFPILQNEWNSSPVRMVKADRRRLQKHRGWRLGVLCCRF